MRDPYTRIGVNLTTPERRELEHIHIESSRRFRNFWVRAMKRQGWTNVDIAKEMELAESTIRSILKKG